MRKSLSADSLEAALSRSWRRRVLMKSRANTTLWPCRSASRTRTVESAAVRVEASRDDAGRLSVALPGVDKPR